MSRELGPAERFIRYAARVAYRICRRYKWRITYNQAGVIGHYYCIREPISQEEANMLGLVVQSSPTNFWIPPQPSIVEGEPPFVKPLTDDVITWEGDEYVVKKIPTDVYQSIFQCAAVRTRAHHLGVNV